MSEANTDRALVLERRRALRKAKKAKGRSFKETKKQEHEAKRQQILTKIREQRAAAKASAPGSNGVSADGCWLCGGTDHRKQDCPNREVGDLTKTCFRCRRRGHTAQNCPQLHGAGSFADLNGNTDAGPNICFNCGSSGHRLRDCLEPRVNGGASFATCFVCQQQGHLSSQCPQSKTGIYPKGGCCKVCKSIAHLARDCPMAKIQIDGSAPNNKKRTFGDDEEEEDEGNKDPAEDDTTGDALGSDFAEEEVHEKRPRHNKSMHKHKKSKY